MKKLRIRVAVVLAVLLLSSCQNTSTTSTPSSPTLTPGPSRVETAEEWLLAKQYLNAERRYTPGFWEFWNKNSDISPNGEWIQVDGVYKRDLSIPLRIVSLKKPGVILERQEGIDSYHLEYRAWSPDSTAFVRMHLPERGRCIGTEIIEIVDETRLESYWINDICAYSFSWSADGRQIALADYENGLHIFNRHGKLIQKIPYRHWQHATWADAGIFLEGDMAIRLLDPEKGIENDFYKDERLRAFEIIQFTPYTNRFLLYWPYKIFMVLDLEEEEFIAKIPIPDGGLHNITLSQPPRYVAMEINVYECPEHSECINPDTDGLWILDWETMKMEYYGEVDDILGWYSNLNAFVVITGLFDETEGYALKIIKP